LANRQKMRSYAKTHIAVCIPRPAAGSKCFERDREKPSSSIELHFCNYFKKLEYR
jgi:hypothetical protein